MAIVKGPGFQWVNFFSVDMQTKAETETRLGKAHSAGQRLESAGGCCWNKVTALINDILFINELESFLEDTSCSIKVMKPICWNAAVWEWSKTTLQVFNEDQNTLKDTENLKLFPATLFR